MPLAETEIRIGTGPWQGPGPHGPVPIARPGASVYLSLSHRAGRGRGAGTRAWIISGTDESLQRDRVRTGTVRQNVQVSSVSSWVSQTGQFQVGFAQNLHLVDQA